MGKPNKRNGKPNTSKETEESKRTAEYRGKGNKPKHDRSTGKNDASWYASNDQILRDAASLSFYNPLGRPFTVTGQTAGTNHITNARYNTVPGVLSIEVLNTPGISTSGNSPMNMAIKAAYSDIRKANSGSKNYDWTDLGMYFLAMDGAYTWWSYLLRIYGTLRMYDQANTYMPDTLLRANHVDPVDLRNNISQYRAFFNVWTLKLATLYMPNFFTFMNRHIWMYANYYLDNPLLKSQIMCYVPHGINVWQPLDPSGSAIEYIDWAQTYESGPFKLHSFAEIVDISNAILDPLTTDEDIGIMGGDILKAYGPGSIMQVSTVADDFVLLPIYNEEVLEQMKHTTLMGKPDWSTFKVTQDNGVLKFDPSFIDEVTGDSLADIQSIYDLIARVKGRSASFMLNFNRYGIEPKDVMVATRMSQIAALTSFTYAAEQYARATTKLKSCGSEIATSMIIFSDPYAVSAHSPTLYKSNCYAAGTYDVFYQVCQLTDFNWAPYVNAWSVTNVGALPDLTSARLNGSNIDLIGYLEDISNYTTIDISVKERLDTCALMSQFNVPRMGLAK